MRNEFKYWVMRSWIVHEVTAAYYSGSSGAAEQRNCTSLDMARTKLLGLQNQRSDLWTEPFHKACFLHNYLIARSSRLDRALNGILRGKRDDVSRVRFFGSKLYVHKAKHQRHGKFDSRAMTGNLGVICRRNAFRVLVDEDGKLVETRDVKIREDNLSISDGASSNDMIECDLLDDCVSFDDNETSILGAEDATDDNTDRAVANTSIEGIDKGVDDSTIRFDVLTNYPRAQHSNVGPPQIH